MVRILLFATHGSEDPTRLHRVDTYFEHHLLSGDPGSELVHFAERENIDLIVMGTHGRTGLTRLLMGSVAEAVVRRAPCPVLTLKQPASALAAAD